MDRLQITATVRVELDTLSLHTASTMADTSVILQLMRQAIDDVLTANEFKLKPNFTTSVVAEHVRI